MHRGPPIMVSGYQLPVAAPTALLAIPLPSMHCSQDKKEIGIQLAESTRRVLVLPAAVPHFNAQYQSTSHLNFHLLTVY